MQRGSRSVSPRSSAAMWSCSAIVARRAPRRRPATRRPRCDGRAPRPRSSAGRGPGEAPRPGADSQEPRARERLVPRRAQPACEPGQARVAEKARRPASSKRAQGGAGPSPRGRAAHAFFAASSETNQLSVSVRARGISSRIARPRASLTTRATLVPHSSPLTPRARGTRAEPVLDPPVHETKLIASSSRETRPGPEEPYRSTMCCTPADVRIYFPFVGWPASSIGRARDS